MAVVLNGVEKVDAITEILEGQLKPKGFEVYPFLIGWYNETVKDKFRLKYSDDTVAYVIVSIPDMFEKSILPFIESGGCDPALDPVDSCIRHAMRELRPQFELELDILHDFETDHNHRPRILVQTAGHVAGAAYFYQRRDVANPPWEKSRNIYGVSVHPRYGGWFALRAVLVFNDVGCPTLRKREPIDIVPDELKRIELLEKFTDSWQDWSFRDIVPVEKRYSDRQKEYFSTLPCDRKELLRKWEELDREKNP